MCDRASRGKVLMNTPVHMIQLE